MEMKGREGEDGSDETVAVFLPRELEMERLQSKGWTEGGLATSDGPGQFAEHNPYCNLPHHVQTAGCWVKCGSPHDW
jgi:hypothetical protein